MFNFYVLLRIFFKTLFLRRLSMFNLGVSRSRVKGKKPRARARARQDKGGSDTPMHKLEKTRLLKMACPFLETRP